MRVVVVGASSGLGRSIGVGLAKNGAEVAFLARRKDRLVDAANDAGGGLVIECDATDPASATAAIDEAAAGLGGIDGLVYAPGVGPLAKIEDLTPEQWHSAFQTNVVGAHLITTAALPHLKESVGTAAFLSTISASHTPPWPGLAAYPVTKAALDKLVEAWRAEHPGVGFTRVIIGDCAGGEGDAMTEFARSWDGNLAMEFMPGWMSKGYMTGTLMPVERLISVVELVLKAGGQDAIHSVSVVPRPPVS